MTLRGMSKLMTVPTVLTSMPREATSARAQARGLLSLARALPPSLCPLFSLLSFFHRGTECGSRAHAHVARKVPSLQTCHQCQRVSRVRYRVSGTSAPPTPTYIPTHRGSKCLCCVCVYTRCDWGAPGAHPQLKREREHLYVHTHPHTHTYWCAPAAKQESVARVRWRVGARLVTVVWCAPVATRIGTWPSAKRFICLTPHSMRFRASKETKSCLAPPSYSTEFTVKG